MEPNFDKLVMMSQAYAAWVKDKAFLPKCNQSSQLFSFQPEIFS